MPPKVSCPYFYPTELRGAEPDSRSVMLPLGARWEGVCRAVPGGVHRPDESLLPRLCHLGYARGHCPHFPADDRGPDAIRFAIRQDEGDSLSLYYVLERDHHPLAHGPLEYGIEARRLRQAPADPILVRQAEAYAESYLSARRRVVSGAR